MRRRCEGKLIYASYTTLFWYFLRGAIVAYLSEKQRLVSLSCPSALSLRSTCMLPFRIGSSHSYYGSITYVSCGANIPELVACAGWFDWPRHCRRDQAWVHAHRQHRWYARQHRHVQGEITAAKTKDICRLAAFTRVCVSAARVFPIGSSYGRLILWQLSLRASVDFEDQNLLLSCPSCTDRERWRTCRRAAVCRTS